jgi:hypothetical protein
VIQYISEVLVGSEISCDSCESSSRTVDVAWPHSLPDRISRVQKMPQQKFTAMVHETKEQGETCSWLGALDLVET